MGNPIYIALFEIKNESFVPEEFGLTSNQFTLDIVTDNSESKNINTTAQPVLDGTTRIDNISREPGAVNISGVIAEHHFASADNPYVNVRPRVSNPTLTRNNMARRVVTEQSRLVLQKKLLEHIRDQALFLDIYMQNGDIVLKNYVLKRVSFTQDKIDLLKVSLSLEEVLLFQNPFTFMLSGDFAYETSETTYRNIYNSINFTPANTSREAVEEAVANVVANLPKSARFIAGDAESYGGARAVDARLPYIEVNQDSNGRLTLKISDYNLEKAGGLVNSAPNSLKPVGTLNKTPIDLFLGAPIYTKNEIINGKPYSTLNGTYHILLKALLVEKTGYVNVQDSSGQDDLAIMMRKDWSGQEFGTSGSKYVIDNQDNFRRAQEKGWSFLRQTKNNTWKLLPNLLSYSSFGYIYNATFATHGFRVGEVGDYKMYFTLTWIHPLYWKAITEKIQAWADLNANTFILEERIYEQ